jgi:hypothetical protein
MEFKTKELRIGNLFIEKYSKEIIEVIELTKDNVTFSGYFPNKWKAKPMPITKKCLLDFGFKKDYKKGYIGKDVLNQDFVLTKPFVMGEWQKGYAFEFTAGCWSKYKEFNYVHELQNFYFAMTGEELQFNHSNFNRTT